MLEHRSEFQRERVKSRDGESKTRKAKFLVSSSNRNNGNFCVNPEEVIQLTSYVTGANLKHNIKWNMLEHPKLIISKI
jgi:hypothetical protein